MTVIDRRPPAGPGRPRFAAVLGAPFGDRQRRELALAVLGLIPGVIGGLLTLALLAAGSVLALVNVGLLLLVPVLVGIRYLGAFHRGLWRWTLGENIPPPNPDSRSKSTPGARRVFAAARGALTAPDGWRAAGYILLNLPLSVVLFLVLVGVRLYGFVFLSYPLWWYLVEIDGERGLGTGVGDVQLDNWPLAFALSAVGVGVLALSTWSGSRIVRFLRFAARSLLGPPPLSDRVRTLEETRSLAVADSVAALRRIERDLHDGAQARLVALAMSLTMAKDKLGADAPPSATQLARARELVDDALHNSRSAIAELRDLVRGIHPPLLDVGLAEALESLVSGAAVTISLDVRLETRPSPAIETIVYFCAAELIANATRHSGATRLDVKVKTEAAREGRELTVTVVDDGGGGAAIGAGTGLTGLVDRIRPVDGTLILDSPPGGPTTAVVRLPMGDDSEP